VPAHDSLGRALVTGSSSGIGRAIALRLSRDGFHVLVHFTSNETGAADTHAEILRSGGTASVLKFDVSDPTAVEKALEQEREISVLVNNAGTHQDGLLGMLSDASFRHVVETNLFGPFYLMRHCVRQMIRRREGCIVNVASLAGQTGNPGQANYAASKAGLIAMTKTLAMEVGSRGIRVNAVAPGLIETEMLQGLPNLDAMVQRIPLQRMGKPEEVAGVVAFLCSRDASYITGQTLGINGGLFPH